MNQLYLIFIFFTFNLYESKPNRKLQSIVYITDITHSSCTENVARLEKFILNFSSDIIDETLNGNLTNGTDFFNFICSENLNDKAITCQLENPITIKGDYYLSSLTGLKHNYISQISIFSVLRVTDTPIEVQNLASSFFKGVEYQIDVQTPPEIYINQTNNFFKFSCQLKTKVYCSVPLSLPTGTFPAYYRNGCGKMVQLPEVTIYEQISISGDNYIENTETEPFNFSINSNIESITYSLEPALQNSDCNLNENPVVCTHDSPMLPKTYNLLCSINGGNTILCVNNAIVIYEKIKDPIKATFSDDSNITSELNKKVDIKITFPSTINQIKDDPSSQVRGISFSSRSLKVILEECGEISNGVVTCKLYSEENANVTLLYKNQIGEYVEINRLEFNDPNYTVDNSGTWIKVSLFFIFFCFL